jgi:hypothetical protein
MLRTSSVFKVLVPYPQVILDFVMRLIEDPSIPAIVVAIDGTALITHAKIPNDLCPCRIVSNNFRSPTAARIFGYLFAFTEAPRTPEQINMP